MNIIVSSPVLASKTRVGKDKYWQAHVVSSGSRWYTQTSYWQVNKAGEKSLVQWSDPYEATPKNVGKANETSAEDQARSEFDSMVTKQRDKGYTEPGTVSNIRPLPMLAQKFSERGNKMQWPVYVQPKYNGQRMLFDGKDGWSRGGKDIIPQCIARIAVSFPTLADTIDGELILPGNVLLQETMKATKKYVPGVSEKLMYRVYDVVLPDMPFSQRYEVLKEYVKNCAGDKIVLAPIYLAHNEVEVMAYHKQFVAEGYEGTMVRDDSEGYTIGQRSNQLQKYKDFVDAEFEIVDVVEGDGRFKGAAVFVCDNGFGNRFNCTPEGSMDHRRDLYTNRKKHIGRYLTIRYQELSRDRVPLFPVGVDIRDTPAGGF
jgi:ATP-dependent DNA ligase